MDHFVYTTMGSVSKILFETTEQHELQNNDTNETFSFFITQHVMSLNLQFETFLGLHDFLDHPFRLGFLAG